MSYITNIILTFSTVEPEDVLLPLVNRFPNKGKPFELVSVHDEHLPVKWYGGTRPFAGEALIGAFNFFELDDFIDYLRSLPWEIPEAVQVFARTEEELKFTVFEIFH